jgi:hypothetical protein
MQSDARVRAAPSARLIKLHTASHARAILHRQAADQADREEEDTAHLHNSKTTADWKRAAGVSHESKAPNAQHASGG